MQFVATTNPEAYDYYLRGRSYMYSMARRDYEHAIRMFEQAIGMDGMYALAYAGMADAYSHLYRYAEATAENVEQANRASEQAAHAGPAIGRSPRLARAGAGDRRALRGGRQEFDIAITQNPNLFEAYCYYGLACSSQGDYEKAAQLYTRAAEVNPADFQVPDVPCADLLLARPQAGRDARAAGRTGDARTSTSSSTRTTRARYTSARRTCFRVGEKDEGHRNGRAGAATGPGRTGRAVQRGLLLRRPGRQ